MGMLDDLLGQAGGAADMIRRNPAIVSAAISLLSSRPGSLGPQDGLAGLIGAFQRNGLGDLMSSWISTGPNRSISPDQIGAVLGADTLERFSRESGIGTADAGSVLADLLPGLVNGVTPRGAVPEGPSLEGALGSLLGSLGR